MRKICVISTCRADYGYLYWIMKDIKASKKLELQIAYPYTHQCREEIWNEFINHNNHAILGDMNSIYDLGQFFDRCLEVYNTLKPDMVLVLGDRFETHAAATAALLLNIPIAHIHGGEITTGSFDNELRNAITQISTYHFTTTKPYMYHVAQMTGSKWWLDIAGGEHYEKWMPECKIYNVGSPGLDWIHRTKLLFKQELQQHVSIDLNQPFIIACFHPETKDLPNTEQHIKALCTALDKTGEQIIFVMPNCDPCNDIIRQVVQSYDDAGKYSDCKPHLWHTIGNLDHLTYLSLLQFAEMMVGNSSSGIIESGSFNLPSVSVGSRQDGRIRGSNVFSCPCETDAILTAVDRAREWGQLVGKCENPYGDGKSSKRIIKILEAI